MDVYYQTGDYIDIYYPDFNNKKPVGIEGALYELQTLSTEALITIRDYAMEELEECFSQMLKLDNYERNFCMETIPFENTYEENFIRGYFNAIDSVCSFGSFEEYCEELRNLLMAINENENTNEI